MIQPRRVPRRKWTQEEDNGFSIVTQDFRYLFVGRLNRNVLQKRDGKCFDWWLQFPTLTIIQKI